MALPLTLGQWLVEWLTELQELNFLLMETRLIFQPIMVLTHCTVTLDCFSKSNQTQRIIPICSFFLYFTCTGGLVGFDKVVWDATVEVSDKGPSVKLTYFSPDGDQGQF